MRIDKYLWSIRVFKTRTQAGEACRTGHVRIGEAIVKASREIKIGDIVKIQQNGSSKTIEILGELKSRVSASQVAEFALDLTPPEDLEAARLRRNPSFEKRLRGLGRPTKKERREIDEFKDWRDTED